MGNATITCLSPKSNETYSGNDSSVVLLLSMQMEEGRTFNGMFTGDISSEVENNVVRQSYKLDYLKVAHHGSRYSSGEAFLARTTPGVSVISAGIDNSYGHPHIETLERLETIHSKVYRTDEQGEITYVIKNERGHIFTYIQ